MSIIVTSNQTDGFADATQRQWIQYPCPVDVQQSWSYCNWVKTADSDFYTGPVNAWIVSNQMDRNGNGRTFYAFSYNTTYIAGSMWAFSFFGGEGTPNLSNPSETTRYNLGITIQGGKWYHACTVYDAPNNDLFVYLNGQLASKNTGVFAEACEGNVRLGAQKNSIAGYKGNIAESRWYNRVLSASEIQTMYALKGKDNIYRGMVVRYTLDNEGVGTQITTDASTGGDAGDLQLAGSYPKKVGGNPDRAIKNQTGLPPRYDSSADGVLVSQTPSQTIEYGDRITAFKSIKKRRFS